MSDVQSRLALEVDHLLAFNPRVDVLCIKLSQRIGIYIKEDEMLLISKKHRLLFFQYHDKTGYRLCLNLVLNLRKRAARVILDADYQTSSVNLLKKLKWIPFSEQAKLSRCCII